MRRPLPLTIQLSLKKLIAAVSFLSLTCALHAQTFDWVAPIDGAPARGMAMVCDAAGNVYVCGNVNGQADFDPGFFGFGEGSASRP